MAVKKIGTLNKHQNPATNENEFDIENYMNVNWDKIKEVVDNNADELTTTQGKVTALETDNTNNKSDIQELQSKNEEQDEKIEEIETNQLTQNDLIERTKDALINITTEKSDNIHVEDSSNLTAKVDVFGTSSQETREGYNLLNVASEFEVTGRSSAIAISLKANTDYTIKVDNIETTNENPTTLAISFRDESDASVRDVAFPYNSKKATFQVTKEATKVYIYSANSYTNSQGITTTYTNLMIYEGTDGKTYEEYGETPSPEIPAEIENVTGDINITVCNKNLLPNNLESTTINGITATVNEDGSIHFKGTATGTATFNLFTSLPNFLKNDTSYRLSAGVSIPQSTYLRIGDNSNNSIFFGFGGGSSYLDFTYKNNFASNRMKGFFWFPSRCVGNSYDFTIYPMLVQGTDNEEYVKHEQQIITFPLSEGQKLMENDYPADDGIHHVRKQVEFDGTENWEYRNTNSSGISTFSIPDIGTEDYKRYEGFKAMCTHFKDLGTVTTVSLMYSKSRGFSFYYNPNNLSEKSFYINTSEQSDLNSFKTWLAEKKTAGTPVIVEYELATEEIEQYTPEQQKAYDKLQNALSYKTVANVFTNQGLLEFKYVADTQTWTVNLVKSEIANTNQQVLNLAGGN